MAPEIMLLRRESDGVVSLCMADRRMIEVEADTETDALNEMRDMVEMNDLGDPFALAITGEY